MANNNVRWSRMAGVLVVLIPTYLYITYVLLEPSGLSYTAIQEWERKQSSAPSDPIQAEPIPILANDEEPSTRKGGSFLWRMMVFYAILRIWWSMNSFSMLRNNGEPPPILPTTFA